MTSNPPPRPPLTLSQQIYADLMDEARLRIHALRDAIAEKERWVPRLLQEFAYLQLRMLCETIALACVVAHDDVNDKDTLKAYKPEQILKRLERLNVNLDPITQNGLKIMNLLEQHCISSADKGTHLLVALSAPEAAGHAMVWVARSPRP